MQVIEIYIEGKLLELSDQTRIGTTFQANNIGELQKRQGNFTNLFKIPLTASNMEALEFSNVMSSNTVLPYRKNSVTYVENGVEIISDGEAIIQKVDGRFLYLNVIGGNVDLNRAIGDLKVGELYPDDVHAWTLANVYNSRNFNDYYLYPFIDWRTDVDTLYGSAPSVDVRQLIACCKVEEMFNRLENYTGYTFTGDYITSEVHENMLLTPSDFSLNEDFFDDLTDRASYLYSGQSGTYIIEGYELPTITVPQGGGYIETSRQPYYSQEDFGFLAGVYYPATNRLAKLKFAFDLNFIWFVDGSYGLFETKEEHDFNFRVQIKTTGGAVLAEKYYESPLTKVSPPYESEEQFIDSVTTPEILIQSGVGYFVNIAFQIYKHSNKETKLKCFEESAVFTVEPSLSIAYGQDIRFLDLFRMRVSDVLKDILNLRGIIIQTNSYTKEVQFNYFQDVIKNKSIARDWSDKIDTRSHVMAFKFGNYGQVNNFIFTEDDNVPEGLGNYYFEINDTTLEAEVDAVKINHSATVQENRYLGANIPKIEGINSSNEWQKPTYRILQREQRSTGFDVTWTDGSSSLLSDNLIPFARFYGFDELAPEFYGALADILERTKVISLNVRLTPVDIQELDFTIPIYLNVESINVEGYFYINKISNYKQGLTPVEFVRL